VGHWKCLNCPPGYFCPTQGKSSISPTDYCSPGYYCKGSSRTDKPVGITEGDICGVGFYCDAGTAIPTECPPGFACPEQGMDYAKVIDVATKTYFCAPGFYCL